MKIDKKTLKQIKPWSILAVFCVVLVFVALKSNDILAVFQQLFRFSISFFYAIGIAYVLNIPMSFFEKNLKKVILPKNFLYKRIRTISIFLTVILAVLIIIVFLSILIPQLIESSIMLTNNLVVYAGNIIKFINESLAKFNLEESNINFDPTTWNQYIQSITENWESILQNATNWVGDAGTMMVKNAVAFTVGLGNWFMGFMLCLYMLSSKESLILQMRKVVAAILPKVVTKKIFEIGHRANDVFNHFISGQLVEAMILGILIYIGMRVFGLGENFEILISTISAIFSLVPMFGAMLAMGFGFVLILAINPMQALLFVVFYQVVQQIEGNMIYPHVVGKSVGLPGMWVLLSIVVFGGFFGMFGMLIAVPSTALLYSLASEFVEWRLKTRNIHIDENAIELNQELDDAE